ncbi:MAG: SsrA-binding protein SmpB [Fimbriimonadaceae bacterium]|nr:SsrA-binding protein SmpB [Fimbriimonadaceae bacterium]
MLSRTARKQKKAAVAPKSIQNRRARYDYAIEDTLEAGIALVGTEVKSLYHGKGNLTDAYCRVVNGEMWLLNFDIEPYEKTAHFGHERRRDRKLLMHRKQIDTWQRKSLEKGFTLIPLAVFFNDKGRVKVQIALARGKAQYDKRESIAKDDARREVDRARTGRD